MANKILVARGTKARLEEIKSTLAVNELVYSTDTGELGVKKANGEIEYFMNATDISAEFDDVRHDVGYTETAILELRSDKQDKLIAGTNITIDENTNVISSTGDIGGTVDWQDVENKPELYDKSEIDQKENNIFSGISNVVNDVDVINDEIAQLDGRVDSVEDDVGFLQNDVITFSGDIDYLVDNKQDKLVAGEHITIENNVISAFSGTANNTIEIGNFANTEGSAAIAIGSHAGALEDFTIAIGDGATASGVGSIAIGEGAFASGDNSIAVGAYTEVTEDNVADFGSERQVRVNLIPVNDRDAVSKNYLESVNSSKQDKLVAGENITIDENANVISASGIPDAPDNDFYIRRINSWYKLIKSTSYVIDINSGSEIRSLMSYNSALIYTNLDMTNYKLLKVFGSVDYDLGVFAQYVDLTTGEEYQMANVQMVVADTADPIWVKIGNGGGGIDLNTLGYMNYAADIFYRLRHQSLFANAWESSLAVDPLEISESSSTSSSRGTLQYPNGEIEGVIIPQGITTIGNYAFNNWQTNNQQLVIPNTVTSIGDNAFSNWSSNNQPLVIPSSVTTIGNNAFQYWEANNQQLIIPNGLKTIGNYAFAYWYANEQPLIIPSSVTIIGQNAFAGRSLVPYIEMQGTPPLLANANAFAGQNDAPIYVPDESLEYYLTAFGWVSLADRIFPISDKDNTYTKDEIDLMIGDIESALDAILGV